MKTSGVILYRACDHLVVVGDPSRDRVIDRILTKDRGDVVVLCPFVQSGNIHHLELVRQSHDLCEFRTTAGLLAHKPEERIIKKEGVTIKITGIKNKHNWGKLQIVDRMWMDA